jgi:hypothetical protein
LNSSDAKQILLHYRPGVPHPDHPQMNQALECARNDAELGRWFEQHCAFQQKMRSKLRSIPVPPHLKVVLTHPTIIRPQIWWQRPPTWLAAAALFLLLAAIAAFFNPRVPDRFSDFENRMVGAAARNYGMDLKTNNMAQLRRFITDRGAPADYKVPPALEQLQLTGGGLLKWRNNHVAMVCFDRGDKQMLFLFVMKRSALKDPPPEAPRVGKTAEMQTVSWSRDGNSYLLAGPEEPGFPEKYLR